MKITHVVPGQPARVICTAGMRERDARMAALVHQQQTAHTLKQVRGEKIRTLVEI